MNVFTEDKEENKGEKYKIFVNFVALGEIFTEDNEGNEGNTRCQISAAAIVSEILQKHRFGDCVFGLVQAISA